MYSYLAVVYNVEPATAEMLKLIAKDKFVREEILIPAVSNKLASLEATLVQNSAHSLTHSLTGVRCRATSVAKNFSSFVLV